MNIPNNKPFGPVGFISVLANIPIAKACSTLTDPEIGVIPARPAMAPFIAAMMLGL